MSARAKAFLTSLLVLVFGGLFVAGYIIGSHAAHPNSVLSQIVFLLVAWVLALLWLLWIVAGEREAKP